MKALRLIFLFSTLLLVTSCNFLTSSNSSEEVDAKKETGDKQSEPSNQVSMFQEGTYKWEENDIILGAMDITEPLDDSFSFMLQAYDGQNVGELSGTAEVDGETATFTDPNNEKCKATFGWQQDQITIDTSEACQTEESAVSFTGIYTFIPVGNQEASNPSEETTESKESDWQEALYIDPKFEQGNLSISNVSPNSFQFDFDISSDGYDGELTGTANITGNEATFQDTDDPACKGTFALENNVITFKGDSCLSDAGVDFSGSFTMTDQKPLTSTKPDASCTASPFHTELLKFAEQGHLKDASIFLGMTEEALKQEKPSMSYEKDLYEGLPGFSDTKYTYLTVNQEVFNLRYNALSEGEAVPYNDLVCQFGEPDEVVFNELDNEYLHVYNAGENKLSFVSDTKEGGIKAVQLESQQSKLAH
ncbi:hypothetical protein [Pseudalkalibacillus hwajinpoensis]|uniref:Uncharacterized protein n=1 Tax=Guptibacillus hwajinpoensis TaxID=208199 RepID=A0A4U1MKY5_9BACL|nr:hypothetical protein [Pseudalkalibacillus hwajinpoensis]TKD72119.1 hypothetical protein FBF83_04790 [Pseudalkalibacillus hwajinpoensis]